MDSCRKTKLIVMSKLTFKAELQKDFREVQDLIITRNEAHDHYHALKMAQMAVVENDPKHKELENTLFCLESLRKYFMTILTMHDKGIKIITFNKIEAKLYRKALTERINKAEIQLSSGKVGDRKTVKDRLLIMKLMRDELDTE